MIDVLMQANGVVAGLGFGSIATVIGWGWRRVQKKMDADKAERVHAAEADQQARLKKLEALKANDKLQHAGTVALLHHEIYELCNQHLARGWVSTDDLNDLGYLYSSYHDLGGNGTGKILYEKVIALPNKPEVA